MRIFPLGENALTIEFGNEISEGLNRSSLALASWFTRNPFPGLIEAVPAYASMTLFYSVMSVRKAFPESETAFASVQALVHQALETDIPEKGVDERSITIPVSFDAVNAPDLDLVCSGSGLSRQDVVEVFLSRTYRVYMLGFLPGFAYMGEVDDKIVMNRKVSPRLRVPKGSVGIAGKQTGIYSQESPGGWQIIGRTDVELFSPEAVEPCLLRPGDAVRFSLKA
ncbi:MAG: 5-oxoprolinase subunit PxpB [Pyrinomonadaceae bacterium]